MPTTPIIQPNTTEPTPNPPENTTPKVSAAWFHDHGVHVFPTVKKAPAVPKGTSQFDYRCTREQAARFREYGVPLGRVGTTTNFLVVVDADNPATKRWVMSNLPPTPFTVTTGPCHDGSEDRGLHFYLRANGSVPHFIHRDGLAIESRNQGQYVVGPGSVRPDGVVYTASDWSWRWEDIPFFPADFVFDDRPLDARGSAKGEPYKFPEVALASERHSELFRLLRSLKGTGVNREATRQIVHLMNVERCRPSLTEDDTFEQWFTRGWENQDRPFVKSTTTPEPDGAAARPSQPESADDALHLAGLRDVQDLTLPELEPRLRLLKTVLSGADPIRRRMVREMLMVALKAKGISGAAALVDAALGGLEELKEKDLAFLADVEPWPDPVEGGAVLNDVAALLERYMILPPHAATTITLWCLHAFLMTAWNTSPILTVLSPVKRCGKSTLMELIQLLVPRGLLVSNLTTSSLFRAVEAFSPTLLSDEADTWLSDEQSELRGVFNSGWRRGTAKILRCTGDEHEPTIFSTWAPKAIAAIRKLPDTIEDRSIIIHLRRKTAGEKVDRFRHDRVEREALPLQRQLQRWADDHAADVARLDPADLAAMNDRAADNWRPLRMLAAAAGAAWPTRADAAALALSGWASENAEELGVRLLGDVQSIFEDRLDEVCLSSEDLTTSLKALEERPWSDWNKGRGLSVAQLAKMLRGFGTAPLGLHTRKTRLDAERTAQRWHRADFADAWTRYLPPQIPSPDPLNPEHPEQTNETGPQHANIQPGTRTACSGTSRNKDGPGVNVPGVPEQEQSVPASKNKVSSMSTAFVPGVPAKSAPERGSGPDAGPMPGTPEWDVAVRELLDGDPVPAAPPTKKETIQ
jgi:Protein of unknown function (DUF3631)/Bifunctional DNA primase/polymerase, N-terminal